jgi:hypothetical protein
LFYYCAGAGDGVVLLCKLLEFFFEALEYRDQPDLFGGNQFGNQISCIGDPLDFCLASGAMVISFFLIARFPVMFRNRSKDRSPESVASKVFFASAALRAFSAASASFVQAKAGRADGTFCCYKARRVRKGPEV